LRLAHRGAMQPAIRTDQQLGRSFAAADRASMTPGTFVPIVFSMLAMSVQLAAGSRLQLAFASSDTDNFESYATLSDVMSVASVSASPARIVLPVLPTE
jgi:predicted acyl esterase